MTLGEKIKFIRISYGDTLEVFGERFVPKANKSNVSAWEKNRYVPNPSRIKIIAELGNTTVDQLLNGGGSMTVDEMKERWVNRDDIEVLKTIYKNEMSVAKFIEAQEEYIYELSHNLENLQEAIYDLVVLSSEARRATRNEPLLLSDIKKD